jgi:transcriptional regulator with XRE-family HTH domain
MSHPEAKSGLVLIGAAIRRKRRKRGLTQRDLERLTGVHQSTISRLETGQRCGLKWSRFARIVGVLGGLDFGHDGGPRDVDLFGPYGLSPNPTVASQQLDAAETRLQAARDWVERRIAELAATRAS